MAKSGVNKVILIGNLGNDPDVKQSQQGSAICNLSIATSESWKDKNTGQQQEKTEWHRVALFGKLAEIAGQYLRKGSKVYIEGKLQTRKWQDQQGQDRYTTEVVVDVNGQMQMLDSRQDGQSQQQQQGGWGQQQRPQQGGWSGQQQQPQQQRPQQQPQGGGRPNYQQQQRPQQQPQGGFDNFNDDIPFAPFMTRNSSHLV